MLKVGDILWTFSEYTYYIGEISELSVVSIGNSQYYFICTNGIIGIDQRFFVPAPADFSTLVKVQPYLTPIYYTISESVAVNYIREHFNETNN